MKRRDFIRKAALSVPMTLGGMNLVAGNAEWNWLNTVSDTNDNILVLIQLNGGNDGLNTFVPIDQYANLYKARENVLIPENALLPIERMFDLRFHPSLKEMQRLWNEGTMGIIQNVGYPSPNKSHFRSTDIWTSASDADVLDNTGWLGRYLAEKHPYYPENYPNEEFESPLALTINSIVSNTCQSPTLNMSFAVNNLNQNTGLEQGGSFSIPDNAYGEELKFIMQSIEQSNAYGSVIGAAADKGTNVSKKYTDTRLSSQLKIVANLISGGLGTKVYVVKIGGFDTHNAQVDANSKVTGSHAELLKDLSSAVDAFFDDLRLQGKSEKVVAMTFSEFGRRTNSNGSKGTDHGEAAPVMLFGDQVMPIVHGKNPEIPDRIGKNHNIPMQIDFRSVYGSLLMDLFGVSESTARSVVHPDFEYFQILGDAEIDLDAHNMVLGQNYPNPVKGTTTFRFTSRGLPMSLAIFDVQGKHMQTVVAKKLDKGMHEITVDLSQFKQGIYLYRFREGELDITKRLVKQ